MLDFIIDLLIDPFFIMGALPGVAALVVAIRNSREIIPGVFNIIVCGLLGLAIGPGGIAIAIFLSIALLTSYTYTDERDPFLSRKSIEEVDFNETNLQFLIRQLAGFGRNMRWLSKSLWRNKVGFVGFVGLVAVISMVTIGTQLIEYEGTTQFQRLQPGARTLAQPPSDEFPLGLDTKGRDILSHIVHGGQDPILTSIQAGLLSTTVAVAFGALAGLIGGLVDTLLTGLANLILTIPNFPLLLVLASIFTLDNNTLIAVVLSSLTWPPLMRSIRAQVLSLKEREYVEAAFSLDLGLFHIITREVFPNLISYIAINFIFSVRLAMYALVGLLLLGILPFREPDWGSMLWSAQQNGTYYNPDTVMEGIAPIVAIAVFQLSLILFSRSLEEVFNPRLRSN